MRQPVTRRSLHAAVGAIAVVLTPCVVVAGGADGGSDAASCGSAGAGDCFSPHVQAGCNTAGCCEGVCALAPYCCDVSWDGTCVELALAGCAAVSLSNLFVNPATGRTYWLLSPVFWTAVEGVVAFPGWSLPTSRTAEENEFLRRFACNSVPGAGIGDLWTGANDRAREGSFEWLSGDPFSFTRWAPGQPDNHDDEDFVAISASTGEWSDLNAGALRRVAVEIANPACASEESCYTDHDTPGCGLEHCCHNVCMVDWECCVVSWDSDCVATANLVCEPAVAVGPMVNPTTRHAYYALTPTTWYEAERVALTMGGHLAVPNSADENTWLFVNFVQPSGGLTLPFLGIHDQLKETMFQALDTVGPSTVGFTKWAAGAPKPNLDDWDAVVMGAGGFWSDTDPRFIRPAIVEVPCVGDLNGSGAIDAADLAILLGAWGNHPGPNDLNFDGAVDASDLAILLGGWGACDTSTCCSVHAGPGCDQKGCTICVCSVEPFCCQVMWDANCSFIAVNDCDVACQCGG